MIPVYEDMKIRRCEDVKYEDKKIQGHKDTNMKTQGDTKIERQEYANTCTNTRRCQDTQIKLDKSPKFTNIYTDTIIYN